VYFEKRAPTDKKPVAAVVAAKIKTAKAPARRGKAVASPAAVAVSADDDNDDELGCATKIEI